MSWGRKQFRRQLPYQEAMSRHHRKPRSLGGTDEKSNISVLPRTRHSAWHTLFQNWSPQRIAEEINERYLDPSVKMVVVPADMVIDPLLQMLVGKKKFKKGECE